MNLHLMNNLCGYVQVSPVGFKTLKAMTSPLESNEKSSLRRTSFSLGPATASDRVQHPYTCENSAQLTSVTERSYSHTEKFISLSVLCLAASIVKTDL